MQSWLVFWNSIFWLALFLFLLNANNLLSLLLYSELVWVILYIMSVFLGSLNDDINLFSTSFFLLALAGLEFSFGLLIIILFKNTRVSYDFNSNSNVSNQFFKKNIKKLYINRYVWKF